jgi:hypothetical protein
VRGERQRQRRVLSLTINCESPGTQFVEHFFLVHQWTSLVMLALSCALL